jgi:hypothetical protein
VKSGQVPFKPLREATRVVVPLLWAHVALSCASLAAAALLFLDVAARLRGSDSFGWTTSLLLNAQPVDGLRFLVALAAVVVFLWWLYRANHNLRAFSGRTLEFTPGWAVGWFFVPVANLIQPYRVVRELWLVSHQRPARKGAEIVGWWWAAFLVGDVLVWATRLVAGSIGSRTSALLFVSLYLGAALVGLIEALVRLALVKGIARAYATGIEEPDSRRGSAQPAGAARDLAVVEAAWYPDPTGRHELRYWNGSVWSSMVADAGSVAVDPV